MNDIENFFNLPLWFIVLGSFFIGLCIAVGLGIGDALF